MVKGQVPELYLGLHFGVGGKQPPIMLCTWYLIWCYKAMSSEDTRPSRA